MSIKWISSDVITDPVMKAFALLCSRNESKTLISNVDTEIRFVDLNGAYTFPVTINTTEWNNSYVCSPYTAFVLYSKEEIQRKISGRLLQLFLKGLIQVFSFWLKRAHINKVVHVNNFMLSTNPYPAWDGTGATELIEFLVTEFPDHAIIFRSLNDKQHVSLMQTLSSHGLLMPASRQVYMYDQPYEDFIKHNNNYQDKRLIRKNHLIYISHEEMDAFLEEALHLYNLLYLEKYSYYNPQFTLTYFRQMYQSRLMYFQGYKDANGKLRAFSGLFSIDNTITSPLVGYDTAAPQSEGLYIHAIHLIYEYMFQSGKTLNLSSGAPKFKRLRGGIPSIEYSAVYARHLSLYRRIVFRFLTFLANGIGVPLLKRYEL